MEQSQLNWIANFIWGIADDVLRDLYVRGKYRDVILPMTVLRRLDAVLEPTKQAVLDMKASLDRSKIANQDRALRQAAGQSFYNTSKFTLRDLKNRASQQYVPFYFGPRSIMLYVIHCANHPELAYRGGQGPIVHLEADLHQAIAWANANGRRWAFALSNAGAVYTQFRSSVDQLDEVNWPAVAATDFRSSDIKEGKQAEFLVRHSFPWHLFGRIGVYSREVGQQVANATHGAAHRPVIEICTNWYY